MSFETSSPTDVVTFQAKVLEGVVRVDVLHDCNNNGIDDGEDLSECDGSPWCDDCNENYRLDVCDIDGGTSADLNFNNVPDECDSIGACCLDDLCFVIREDLCATAGGTYLGHGVSCAGQPCGAPSDLPDVDGVLDDRYGTPLAVQDTQDAVRRQQPGPDRLR